MSISFFEEFPTKKNLAKLNLITFPIKLYLAAPSKAEFLKLKSRLKSSQIQEVIYWPLLKKSEGYWISPFSNRSALSRIFEELNGSNLPVMLDLELPTNQNPLLYLTQLLNFFRNKRLITTFIKEYFGPVYCAEYYPQKPSEQFWLTALGLNYQIKKIKVIKMLYHSLHNFSDDFLNEELSRGRRDLGDNFLVAYGTITTGISGREPLLSLPRLKKDLELAKKAGIKEVIIFRLGGLTLSTARLLKQFSD